MLLSRNYAPSDDLTPFIRQHYVFEAHLPEGFELIDKLMSETAFIRILLKGDWAAGFRPGEWSSFGTVPLMGANGVPLPVRVRGPFHVVGIALRPMGWRSLFNCPATDIADNAIPLSEHWGGLADELCRSVGSAADDQEIVSAIEAVVRTRLADMGNRPPVETVGRFEHIARHDSTMPVADIAEMLGLSTRQLERTCKATFGHTPKVILRRSRFLDTSQAMRGFGEPSEEQLTALRYFDQSHLNREFRHFFDMTPGQFEKATTPLFTAGLKLRADGRA
ncbi:MAG TPA: AraC family transcriptional regulator [Sphingobium sp.]